MKVSSITKCSRKQCHVDALGVLVCILV